MKVLFISYYYPPLGGIGSLRSQKFAHYLPEYGWQPFVLTPECGSYFLDSSLGDGRERGVNVVRTHTVDLSTMFKRALPLRLRVDKVANFDHMKHGDYPIAEKHIAIRKLRQLIHNWIYIPDGQIGWYPYAVQAGKRMLDLDSIDVIWSTSFPVTAHMVAHKLKLATGKPWVADFRDLWTENQCANYTSALRKRLDQYIEMRLLENTDAIMTVSKSLAESIRRLTSGTKRVEVIRNGFDSNEFLHIERTQPTKWTVTFVGSYYSFYDPSPFLGALQQLIKRGMIAKEDICFRVVGEPHPFVQELVNRYEMSDITHFTGYVSHREALRYQVESSLLLFTLHGDKAGPGIITGKLYEYLGSRRPILGIVQHSYEAAQIIKETCAGITVEATDGEGIYQCLLASYSAFKADNISDLTESDLSQFEHRYSARQLADLLTEIAIGR